MSHQELVEQHVDSLTESVSAVRDSPVQDQDAFGSHAISGIFSLSSRVELILSYENTRDKLDAAVSNEYHSLRLEVEELRSTEQYQEQAIKELETRIDHFENMVENVETYGHLPDPFDNMVWNRDTLEFVIEELDPVKDVNAYRPRIEEIDERFRRAYEAQIDDVLKRAPHIEQPYYPESFWWRHPSRIAAELESSSSNED